MNREVWIDLTDATLQTPSLHTKTPFVAVVDDDPDILELITTNLAKNGMKTRGFPDGEAFYRSLRSDTPDLVVLDLMLPDSDGIEICRYLRREGRFSKTAIIMVTARADEIDKVLGLEMGADDYLTKPFSPKELVARVRAVLRRTQAPREEGTRTTKLGGILTIDAGKHEVIVGDSRADVTAVEFRILQFLATKPGWVFSRESILDHLWGNDKAVTDRSVDVHVRHLREKLGPAATMIRNVRGVGYKLEP